MRNFQERTELCNLALLGILAGSLLLLLGCNKDTSETLPFRSPAFFQGKWKSPTEDFSDGSSFTWFEFDFTSQTIIETNHLYQRTIDYRQTFPIDKFEIAIQKSDNNFEITVTSKTGDSVPYSFLNQFYRKFARLRLADGSEGIELLFGGTSGAYLIRD
ncbi:MAG: hypothetical protein RLZZ241_1014 [Bacteroidota bacterium]